MQCLDQNSAALSQVAAQILTTRLALHVTKLSPPFVLQCIRKKSAHYFYFFSIQLWNIFVELFNRIRLYSKLRNWKL